MTLDKLQGSGHGSRPSRTDCRQKLVRAKQQLLELLLYIDQLEEQHG